MKTPSLPVILGLLFSASLSAAADKIPLASFIDLPWRYVIGGFEKGQWLDSEGAGKRLAAAKTEYRVFTLKGEMQKVKASGAAPDVDVCPDVWLQKISPEPDPLQKGAVGVSTSWDPMPRKAVFLDAEGESHRKAVHDLLVGKGLAKPQVKIRQLLQVDLDGDGHPETLITARHFQNEEELMSLRAGDYNVVLLQRQAGDEVQTRLLTGDVFPKDDDSLTPVTYDIAGLLDLNGDGRLEVIIDTGYYEGGGVQVWEIQGDVLVKVLDLDCGV